MNIILAPNDFENNNEQKSHLRIFLAGSIEMGKAEEWQNVFATAFSDYDIDILNPRREHFDETITQNADDPEFKKQVEWEQRGLAVADIIAFYFDPQTESPISLLELGLFAHSHKIFVCCPKGFWKKGNVDLVCDENSIPRFENMEDLIIAVKTQVEKLTR